LLFCFSVNHHLRTANDIYISNYRERQSLYPWQISIFTDGPKQNNHSTNAVVLNFQTMTKIFPNSISVYTAELFAILMTLTETSQQQNKHYITFMNLCLYSVANKILEHPHCLSDSIKIS